MTRRNRLGHSAEIDSRRQLKAVSDELLHWMCNDAWPLWEAQGLQSSYRFHEAISLQSGLPTGDSESRVRTQARQVYSFALAHDLGWHERISANIVRRALPVMLQSGLRNDGIAGRRISTVSGQLTDANADLYDTAFCLLALAQGRDIVGQDYADDRIDRILSSVDNVLKLDADNGYRESIPEPDGRLQNPHMHFFESLLLIYEKTGNVDILSRSEALYQYIKRSFFDEESGLVHEVVAADGSAMSEGYDPGHSMEWVWLLGFRSRLRACALPDFAYALYARACAALQHDEITRMQLSTEHHFIDGSARLWSQAETLKGHLCITELGHSQLVPGACEAASKCARRILDTWLNSPVRGGWLDHFGSDGKLIATDIPASTGYHLYLAISELKRISGTALTHSNRNQQYSQALESVPQ